MIIYKINDIEFTTDFKLKSVIDKIEHSICDVLLNITTLDGNKQVLNLTGFEYTDVWYDEDVIDWVQIKLEEYKDTSGFYKYVEEEQGWWYAPNFVYHKDYTLERNGNKREIDGWKWYDKAPKEYLDWKNNLEL